MDSCQTRQIILVTGATRSGKSEWAEALALNMNQPVTYLATARESRSDQEWQARIQQHRRRRPPHWQTLEVPTALSAAIEASEPPNCLLVDSLGTWTANLLEQQEGEWQEEAAQLLESLSRAAVDIILVGEEVGWGLVPAYETGRQFRDRLGHLLRQIGAIATTTYLVVGGHALNLSQLGKRLNDSGPKESPTPCPGSSDILG